MTAHVPFSATLEDWMANAIRALAMDAVQAANSGHPGAPMVMADVATVLFNRLMTVDPSDHRWPDRDRFVMSAGPLGQGLATADGLACAGGRWP